MHFISEWWTSAGSLALNIVSLATAIIGFVLQFLPEWASRSIREWARKMKPCYKWSLRILSILLIISALMWTAINIFNEQQNTIVSLNNTIENLTHPKPYFEPWMYYVNENPEGNTVEIQGVIGFINQGNGAAYQLQVRGCYATNDDLTHVTDFSFNLYKAKRPVGGNYTVPFIENFPSSVTGNSVTSTTPWLYIYCALRYSDAPKGGNWSEPCEQWLGYSQALKLTPLKESPQTDAFALAVSEFYYGNETWD